MFISAGQYWSLMDWLLYPEIWPKFRQYAFFIFIGKEGPNLGRRYAYIQRGSKNMPALFCHAGEFSKRVFVISDQRFLHNIQYLSISLYPNSWSFIITIFNIYLSLCTQIVDPISSLYSIYIYPSVHKQLIRYHPNPFRESIFN